MLSIIYSDKQSSFKELLEKNSFISIHESNIQILATEMYRVINNFSPVHMKKVKKWEMNIPTI